MTSVLAVPQPNRATLNIEQGFLGQLVLEQDDAAVLVVPTRAAQLEVVVPQAKLVVISETLPGPGLPGPAGPVGPAGAQGIQGVAGVAGTSGAAGPAGPAGPTGPAGADSTVPGPAGPVGPAGAQGIQGVAGVAGSSGAAGPAGPAGPTGPAGADSTVPGPVGPAGAQGIQGLPGNDAPARLFVQTTRPLTAGPWTWWKTDASGAIIDLIVNDGVP
jgi:Collagen triple helix repeat (20 copies)